MAAATLTSKGQITVPKEVRRFLSLGTGDRLDFIIEQDGEIRLKPSYVEVSDLKGILKTANQKVVSLEEMRSAIQGGYERRHAS